MDYYKLVCALVLLFTCIASDAKCALPQAILADNSSLALLIGYDSLTGEIKSQCVELVPGKTIPNPQLDKAGITSGLLIDESNSFQSLLTEEDLSLAASFGWGKFKSSATFAELNSSHSSSFNQVLTVRNWFQYATQLISPSDIQLSNLGKLALKQNKFRDICGDSYMRGQIWGGDFAAVFRASSHSDEEQKKISSQLNASFSGLVSNGRLAASESSSINKLVSDNSLHVEVLRHGATSAVPTDAVSIMNYAATYTCRFGKDLNPKVGCPPEAVGADAPIVVKFAPSDYSALIATAMDDGSISMQEASAIASIYQQIADLQYALSSKSEFGEFSSTAVRNEIRKLQKQLFKLSSEARTCKATANCDLSTLIDKYTDFDNMVSRAEVFSINANSNGAQNTSVSTTSSDPKAFEIRGAFLWQAGDPNSRCAPATCNAYRILAHTPNGQLERTYKGGVCMLPPDAQVDVALLQLAGTGAPSIRGIQPTDAAQFVAFAPMPGSSFASWDNCGIP
ncbi:MAG TPA: hypothetical protein VMF58_16040 [Rhizomicrobium sp.]|nr:hypothetical protein [Rhizomicrobium sp.]